MTDTKETAASACCERIHTEAEIVRLLNSWPCHWCGGSTPIYPTNHSPVCRGRTMADERGLTK